MTRLAAALVLLGLQACASQRCAETSIPVGAIQGADFNSPMIDQLVSTQVVLTAPLHTREGRGGWFAQSPQDLRDDDPRTSEGILLFGLEDGSPGERLWVKGRVMEYGRDGDSTTALHVERRQSCGAQTPEPLAVRLPLRGHIESLEGMLVAVSGEFQITDLKDLHYRGEVRIADQPQVTPTEMVAPGSAAREMALEHRRRSLLLDDGDEREPAVLQGDLAVEDLRVGDAIDGVEGVVAQHYGYRLHVTRAPRVQHAPRQDFAPPQGELLLAAFNVENLFNGDGEGGGFPTSRGARTADELKVQLAKLAAAIDGMGRPHALALAELENDGTGEKSAVAELTRALQGYRHVSMPGPLGEDDISVAIIYQPAHLEAIGPGFSVPAAQASRFNRPPVAQRFRHRQSGVEFTLVSVHLKSKSCRDAQGDEADQGDGQACWNPMRVEESRALVDWLDSLGQENVVLAGDFNAYTREDPIEFLARAGFQRLPTSGHSYIFRGQAGNLDHILVRGPLGEAEVAAVVWPINAQVSQGRGYRGAGTSDARRSSDHNPVVAGFSLQ